MNKSGLTMFFLLLYAVVTYGHENTFYVNVKGAPSMTYRLKNSDNNSEFIGISYNIGLNAGYRMNQTLSFETGIQSIKYKYYFKQITFYKEPIDLYDNSTKIETNIIMNYNYIKIPFIIKISKVLRNKISLNSYFGLSTLYFQNAFYDYKAKYNNKWHDIFVIDFSRKSSDIKKLNLSFTAGFGISKSITSKIDFVLSGEYDLMLFNNWNLDNKSERLYYACFWFGLKYNL